MKDIKHQNFLALDPSINQSGVALYQHGVLTFSATLKVPKVDKNTDITQRVLRMGQEVMAWISEIEVYPHTLVVEHPMVYPGPSGKDPNNLFGLSGVNGCVAGALAVTLGTANLALTVKSLLPRDWSKMPKSKTGDPRKSVRARYIRRCLTEDEALNWDAKKISHDEIDAIGIGLFALGRVRSSLD